MPVHLTNEFESAWDAVIAPWFAANRCRFLTSDKLSVILVPSLSCAQALRARLAEEHAAFAGIHFWVPADARRFLGAIFPDLPQTADRETLRLVLSAVAAESLKVDPELLSAKAVASHPDALLESLERLAAAGWSHEQLSDEQLISVGRRFEERLSQLGFAMQQVRDFEIARRLRVGEFGGKPIESLLIAGYSAAHWGHWPVLESLVRVSAEASICIRPMRNDGLGLEATWAGSWEGLLGPAAIATADRSIINRPTYRYAEAIWAGTSMDNGEHSHSVTLAPTLGIAAQARAAVWRSVEYLGKGGSKRIGILVPSNGALAREIGAELEKAQVPYWNDLGTPKPGFFESSAWKALIAYLQQPSVPAFLAVVGAGAVPKNMPVATRAAVEAILRKGRTRSFFEDWTLLTRYLAAHGEKEAGALGKFLVGLPQLPPNGTVADMRSAFEAILAAWGWTSAGSHIFNATVDADPLKGLLTDRESFLRWVGERANSASRTQGDFGANPYARVVLSTYAKADGLPWTYLIATGLNEGSYPPPYGDIVFVGEETIYELNEKVRSLNEQSRTAVPGLGERVIDGKGMMIGPVEERWIAQQAFVNALEETKRGATGLMSVFDEAKSGAEMRPGEYFVRMFEADYGHVPDMGELRRAALAFESTDMAEIVPHPEVRIAYDARRDRTSPFDEFSFCFRSGEARPIKLGASGWEAAFKYPATQWCRAVLGVTLDRLDTDLPWNLTVGEWVHAWLASAGGTPGTVTVRSEAGLFLKRVNAASEKQHTETIAFFESIGRELPRWWEAAFENARLKARQLAMAIDAISITEWPAFACETALPKGASANLPSCTLELGGVFDLVLFNRAGPDLITLLSSGVRCWLFDFKTGQNKPLSGKGLARGEGIQLGLYALSLENSGASDAALTLLKAGSEAEQQVTLGEIKGQVKVLGRLSDWQHTGRFGQLEQVRSEFTAATVFPLATLPVPVGVLNSKAELTYSALED